MSGNQHRYAHILITGASSGIGEALACHYAGPGVRLSLVGRDQARLSSVVKKCKEAGALCDMHIGDVTDYEKMAVWLAAQDQVQPIDLLIANAGISGGTGKSQSPESFSQVREIFSVNTLAMINQANKMAMLMQKRKSGHIALIGSIAGFQGWPGAPAYTASKAAIHIYGEALQALLQPDGVSLSIICPGFIETPMTQANAFPMPFLISAQRAALYIDHGLKKKKKYIIFPWPMYMISLFARLCPSFIMRRVIQRLPAKDAT